MTDLSLPEAQRANEIGSNSIYFRQQRSTTRMLVVSVLSIAIAALIFESARLIGASFRRSHLYKLDPAGGLNISTREIFSDAARNRIGKNSLRLFEPIIQANISLSRDNDMSCLSSEAELQELTLGNSSDCNLERVLQSIRYLPSLQTLGLFRFEFSPASISLLQCQRTLRTLKIGSATEPSLGLLQLSKLSQIKKLEFYDHTSPASVEVYRQIAMMPGLRFLTLARTPSLAEFEAISHSETIETISIDLESGVWHLGIEYADCLGRMPALKFVACGSIDPEIKRRFQSRISFSEVEMLVGE